MKKVIGHSVYPYLPITENWIYSQLMNITQFESVVITDKVMNTGIFPYDRVFCIYDGSSLDRLVMKIYNRILHSYNPVVNSIIRENGISLLHSHFGNIGWRDMKTKQKAGIPQVTTFYGYDLSGLAREDVWRKRYGELFKHCDLFTVEGSYMKNSLVNLGCAPEKVVVRHLGIDLDMIPPEPRLVGADGIIRILVSATFREKKGIPYAVEAFGILCGKYDNIVLTVIGDANNDKEMLEKRKIQAIVSRYGIEDKVRFLGYIPHDEFIKESRLHHIFLSPSVQAGDGDNEGGVPVSVIEMSAAGMPVVATRHCDIPEAVVDGKSGLLARERSAGELVERLEYLIEKPSLWNEMGQYGRMHIEKEYDSKKQVLQMEKIYGSLL